MQKGDVEKQAMQGGPGGSGCTFECDVHHIGNVFDMSSAGSVIVVFRNGTRRLQRLWTERLGWYWGHQ